MLFLQKILVMTMMMAAVAGGVSLAREDLAKLDRNVVQMYEMVHTKVTTYNSLIRSTVKLFKALGRS